MVTTEENPTAPAAPAPAVEPIKRDCIDCKQPFPCVPILFNGHEVFPRVRCDRCGEIAEAKRVEEEEKARVADLTEKWRDICPPLYRETDLEKLKLTLTLSQEILSQILNWQPNPKGIGLSGETGVGKTRLMFLLLDKLHFEGKRVMASSGKQFERYCHRMFDDHGGRDARQKIEEMKYVPVLFVDDIGKEKYTERVGSEFYDLIEYRTSHLKPILWTANSTGEQLEDMLGVDRGAPIVRRLREFCTVQSV